MKRSLPVWAGLWAALAFVPRAWAGAWAALGLAFALLAAPGFAESIPFGAQRWAFAAWIGAAVVVGLMAEGALYRLGVSRTAAEARKLGLGIGGVQLALPELRLLGAGAVIAGFIGLVLAAFVVLFAFVLTAESAGLPSLPEVGTAARAGEGWAIWIAALGVLAVVALVQFPVRLSLYKAATVARGRLVAIDSLSLAQGAFWPLLGGLAAVLAPVALIEAWEHGLIGAGFVMPVSSRAYVVIRAAFLALAELPFAVGFLSYAYNRLEYRPGDEGS